MIKRPNIKLSTSIKTPTKPVTPITPRNSALKPEVLLAGYSYLAFNSLLHYLCALISAWAVKQLFLSPLI